MVRPVVVLLALLTFCVSSACSDDDECRSNDDCLDGEVCVRGACDVPRANGRDLSVHDDLPDTLPDLSFDVSDQSEDLGRVFDGEAPDMGAEMNYESGDRDGDGIPDEEDNCPDVWNPAQADLDDDEVGDLCDDDVDGDGVPNDRDNCKFIPNPDQAESSGDGVG